LYFLFSRNKNYSIDVQKLCKLTIWPTLTIKIIRPTSGLNTSDRILELLQENPRGMTVKSLSDRLNRPVSMIHISLKSLVATKKITAQKEGDRWIYF
jgi:predicted transcriptional regulator